MPLYEQEPSGLRNLCALKLLPDEVFFFFIDDGHKHMPVLLKQAPGNGDNLVEGLTFGKDYFGKADAVRSVEIEEEVFPFLVEHVHEPFLDLVGAELPPLVCIEQILHGPSRNSYASCLFSCITLFTSSLSSVIGMPVLHEMSKSSVYSGLVLRVPSGRTTSLMPTSPYLVFTRY